MDRLGWKNLSSPSHDSRVFDRFELESPSLLPMNIIWWAEAVLLEWLIESEDVHYQWNPMQSA